MDRAEYKEQSDKLMRNAPAAVAHSYNSANDGQAGSKRQHEHHNKSGHRDITWCLPRRYVSRMNEQHDGEVKRNEQQRSSAGLSVNSVHSIQAAEQRLQKPQPRRQQQR
ncbi:hypothetical protein D3C84_822740 [compost metagenome]